MVPVHLVVELALFSCCEDCFHRFHLVALLEILLQFLQSLTLIQLELVVAGLNAGLLLFGPFGVELQDMMCLDILRQWAELFRWFPWRAGKDIDDLPDLHMILAALRALASDRCLELHARVLQGGDHPG